MNEQEEEQNNMIGLEVIRVLVSHGGKDLLGIRQLGRLSLVSKSVSGILDEASVWKSLFEEAAACGRGSYAATTGHPLYGDYGHFLRNGYRPFCWIGEKGLLRCFSDPSDALMGRIGYKRAAGCLLGKCCKDCGRLAGYANPLTFERICISCYDADESSYMISKSKAKEAFLLSEKDVKALPKAEFDDIGIGGKAIVRTSLLMSDAKAAAFAKYGGADGLAAKIQTKKDEANLRYRRKLNTSKPLKKRPKITRMTDRPADDLKDIRSRCHLPIGTFFDTPKSSSPAMKMTYSFKCNQCEAHGCLADVVMHEKLEHGSIVNYHTQIAPLTVGNCDAFPGLSPISNLPGATQGLIDLFASASSEYASLSIEDCEERKVCIISFDDNDVKVCVDLIVLPDPSTSLFSAYLDVCFKKGSEHVPLKVMHFDLDNGHECDLCREDDFKQDNFDALTTALGIDVDAVTLMAMFLSRILGREQAKEIYDEVVDDVDMNSDHHSPMFHDVWKAVIGQQS